MMGWELHYQWIGVALLVALQIFFSLHVLLTKTDDPSENAFWLVALWLLPLGGMLCYLFFGITRLKHITLLINQAESKYKEKLPKHLTDELAGFLVPDDDLLKQTLARTLPRSCFYGGNHLELLHDGVAAYPRMLADIEQAKRCIRMQSYIIMNDEIGRKMLEMLRRKAAEGVDVKILFDNLGSLKSVGTHYFKQLMRGSTPHFMMKSFSPLNLFAPWKFQMRNHRKLLVIDGKVAYSGGINISDGNEHRAGMSKEKYIHDLHCRITGPVVLLMTMSFFHNWVYSTRRKLRESILREDFPVPEQCGNDVVRVVPSGPGADADGSRKLFFTAASLAREKLYIATPYFVPDISFITMLIQAARRGVDVRLIVPSNSDHKLVALASEANYRKLLESGVKIYYRQGYFSHIKLLQVDGQWGFMGSSNCDNRSFHLNFELDFCFAEGDFASEIAQTFRKELEHSKPIRISVFKKRTIVRRLGESLCALISPIL